MSRLGRMGSRLYTGEVSFDFVGRRRLWYGMSAVIVAVAVAGLVLSGLNFGIEFRGGVEFDAQLRATESNVIEVREAVAASGVPGTEEPIVTASGDDVVRVQTEPLTPDQVERVEQAILDAGATEVSQDSIGPTWGAQVASKALTGLLVFLVLVVIVIWAYFREWKMSIAGIVALAHDVLITVGVYALSGFEVTPATVTGLLTILGYSLYDTVVVFDKVRENTRGITANTRQTYSEAANLAVNQTLVRSINTSVAALLPVGAILYVGVFALGSGPLKDLALALFVGMAAGTYSSIFIATPLLAQLKEREPAMRALSRRVAQRRAARGEPVEPVRVGAAADPAEASGSAEGVDVDGTQSAPPPAARTRPVGSRSAPQPSPSARRAQPQRRSRSRRRSGRRR